MHLSLKKTFLTLFLTTNSIAYSQSNWEVLPNAPTTTIAFQLKKRSTVSLTIYNTVGQIVKSLLSNSTNEAVYHEVRFDGSTLWRAIYI